MSSEEISVDRGDRANLRIENDTPPEFHLHGYDLEEEAKPDRPAGSRSTRRLPAASRLRATTPRPSWARFSYNSVREECRRVNSSP